MRTKIIIHLIVSLRFVAHKSRLFFGFRRSNFVFRDDVLCHDR